MHKCNDTLHSYGCFFDTFSLNLTKNTKVSFLSSNSSFVECVRKQVSFSQSSLSSSFLSNNDCDSPSYEECSFTGTARPTISTVTTFTHCTFSNMLTSGDNGGAICCKSSSTSITLASCSIINCNSTKNGGGVYASGTSNTLSVDDCLFKDCVTSSHESITAGGGMYMSGSTSSLIIHSSTFSTCKATVEDYGGAGLMISNLKIASISSSRFILCSTNSRGGGVYINEFTPVTFTDILFSGNTADVYGGAIREYENSRASTPHLKYSFFTNNSAGENYGNDFSVDPEISKSPFLQSFSTATSNRVSVYNNTDRKFYLKDNWLPHDIVTCARLLMRAEPLDTDTST